MMEERRTQIDLGPRWTQAIRGCLSSQLRRRAGARTELGVESSRLFSARSRRSRLPLARRARPSRGSFHVHEAAHAFLGPFEIFRARSNAPPGS